MKSLILHIAPVAWGRVKRGAYGQAYVPAKTREFEAEAARILRTLWLCEAPLKGPVRLCVDFLLARPKRPKFPWPAVRPDLDNYQKAIKDAANGILWHDDGQVVEVLARKMYAEAGSKPRIEIEVSQIGGAA